MTARSLPCALCSVCGAYSYDLQVIDTICGSTTVVDPPCNGQWLNKERFIDWVSCQTCSGTGYDGSKRCASCKNSGWVPAR